MAGADIAETDTGSPTGAAPGGPAATHGRRGRPVDEVVSTDVLPNGGGGGDGVDPPAAAAELRRTVRWASLFVLGPVALLLVAVLWQAHGRFVYVLDDPAIHLTVARRLAYDGTWGIVPGEFQAASSSPLWTLLLAPTQLVARGTVGELVPLLLNLLAGLWVVRLLGPDLHRVLRPARRRPLDVAATAVVVVALLFLPGLAFFGMEHTLHMALVLATVLAVERRWVPQQPWPSPPPGPAAGSRLRDAGVGHDGRTDGAAPGAEAGSWARGRIGVVRRLWDAPPAWLPLALMALATLTRGESAFVAVGIAVGLLVVDAAGRRPVNAPAWRARLGIVAGLGIAIAAALGVVAVVNVAFGQGLLPNSVLAKTFGDRGDTRRSLAAALDRLVTDRLMLALAIVAVLVLVREWRRKRAGRVAAADDIDLDPADRGGAGPATGARLAFPATVLLVAIVLHVELAAVDSSLRYEAYLLGVGVLVLLRLLADLFPLPLPVATGVADGVPSSTSPPPPAAGRRRLVGALLVLLLLPAAWQVHHTLLVPHEAGVMWEQRYQVARFLDRAYGSEPIAIGELGYIGLYHDGPLTDVYGLGDHEVLEASLDDRKSTAYWRDLQARRGFPLLVTYDFSLEGQQPTDWLMVATWRSPDAHFEVTEFWATVPEEVGPLRRHLEAYEAELPGSVEVTYNNLAPFAAGAQAMEADAERR